MCQCEEALRHTFYPRVGQISVIFNLTAHSGNSERLVIIHGRIEVLMLLVKKTKNKELGMK